MDSSFRALRKLLRGEDLEWWEWAKIIFVATSPLMIFGSHLPLVGGIALHLFLDFTMQSDKVALEKGSGGASLWAHAIAVGGWSGGAIGFWANELEGFLLGVLLGFVGHLLVDITNKFGIKDWRVGILVDQSLHITNLFIVMLLV